MQTDMLAAYVGTPIALACLTNVVLFAMKTESERAPPPKGLPPGWVVGLIWVFVLALLGFSQWRVRGNPVAFWAFSAFITFCLIYPFLSNMFPAGKRASLDRLTMFLVILLAVWTAMLKDGPAIIGMVPLILWVIYVNIATSL